eukprot:snap_masked-scaffold_113-processed-gene-0.1-mRNA-1 protein AED:1.00 eAED:1.00 QI:0/0/0/0/1/1/2/0/76
MNHAERPAGLEVRVKMCPSNSRCFNPDFYRFQSMLNLSNTLQGFRRERISKICKWIKKSLYLNQSLSLQGAYEHIA